MLLRRKQCVEKAGWLGRHMSKSYRGKSRPAADGAHEQLIHSIVMRETALRVFRTQPWEACDRVSIRMGGESAAVRRVTSDRRRRRAPKPISTKSTRRSRSSN